MAGESPVARVVGRYGHDGARAVAGQHVVRNIDRYLLAGERVDGVGAREDTAHPPRLGDAFAFRPLARFGDVGFDGGAAVGRRQLLRLLVFGGDDHERYAEDRVGAGREDLQFPVRAFQVEEELRADRTADPVALDLLERLAPCEFFQPVEHPLGIGRYAQQPLLHPFLLHRIAAAHREAVAHFVVGEHRAQLRTPVDHRVGAVGETVVLKHPFAFAFVPAVPLRRREAQLLRAGGVDVPGAAGREGGFEFGDRPGPPGPFVVVVAEHFEEGPLGPLVVFRIARAHFAVPVEREPDLVELLAVAGDVALGRCGGMLPRLDGILLRRQSECVVAHRVQHVESLLTLVARVDVRGDVAERMAHVQPRARGVGKHVEHVEFRPRGVSLDLVGLMFFPVSLPLGFQLFEIVFHRFSAFCSVRETEISGKYTNKFVCPPRIVAGYFVREKRTAGGGAFGQRAGSCLIRRPRDRRRSRRFA